MKYSTLAELLRHWFFILPFSGDWNYENPNLWPEIYPQCGGRQQSPIALETRNSNVHNVFNHLQLYNYRKPLAAPVEMINNGYSAEIGVRINTDGSFPFLTFGGSTNWYEVQAIHFHWGSDGVLGSEHTIDGVRYDLEMHIVHKNYKYATVEEARENDDGFVVLAVLFKGVEVHEQQSHESLNKIYDALQFITQYENTTNIPVPIAMSSLLPDLNTSEYFTYKGSLTTPPCSEAVQFFVFTDVLSISFEDLRKFWSLLDANGEPLLNNFRPLQKSNSIVYLKRRKLIFY